MARHKVPGGGFLQGGVLLVADGLGVGAAGAEPAPGLGVDRAGQVALDAGVILRTRQLGVGNRDAAQKPLGVGVQRVVVNLLGFAGLDQLAQVHNADIIRNIPHHRQIVGNEQIGRALGLLIVAQQVHDLCLNRNIQRGDRLVTDDQFGVEHQRAGDTDTLPLPARELVRIPPGMLRRQADTLEHGKNLIVHILAGLADVVRLERLGDDIMHRHAGVQRGVRVLEDHLHLAADGLQLALFHMGNVLAVQDDLALARLIDADDGTRAAAFAAAALAHQAEGAAPAQRKADIVHGVDLGLGADREIFGQVFDLQDRLFHHCALSFALAALSCRGLPSAGASGCSSQQRALRLPSCTKGGHSCAQMLRA